MLKSAARCDVNNIDFMFSTSLSTNTVRTEHIQFSPITANINMSIANEFNPVIMGLTSDLTAHWKLLNSWNAPPDASLPVLQSSLDDARTNAVLTYKHLKTYVELFNGTMYEIYLQLSRFGPYTYNEIRF